jgi:ATP-dependent RNA helicase DDX46/PRP5
LFNEDDDDDDSASGVRLSKFGKKMKTLHQNGAETTPNGAAPMEGVEKHAGGDHDELEAFMAHVDTEVKKLQEEDLKLMEASGSTETLNANGMIVEAEEVVGEARQLGDDEFDEEEEEDIIGNATKKMAAKRKDLASVDHSVMNYEPFKKDFFVEPPELASLTEAEVDIKRAELGGIKIRGVNCPKPVERWAQMGLPPGTGDIIKRVLKYDKPTSIQCQAIPAIMSGRDVIGIAKTGSGKVLFLLWLLRRCAC